MLNLEDTKKAVQLALQNPKEAHKLIKNLPELYSAVDKHLNALNLNTEQLLKIASIYTKRAFDMSPLKNKLTETQKNQLGLAAVEVEEDCMIDGDNGKYKIYTNPAQRLFMKKVEDESDNITSSLDRGALIEALSEIFHESWMHWSKAVADQVQDEARIARWKNYWVPYEQLDEPTKDLDREWAEKALKNIEPLIKQEKMAKEMVTRVETQYPEVAKLLRVR